MKHNRHFFYRIPNKISIFDQAVMSDGFFFMLFLLLIRFTRGSQGVLHVAQHVLKNWKLFREDFNSFCVSLVEECEQLCAKHGKTYLSHREGLHTGLSGIHFIRTLRRSDCRNKLVSVATESSDVWDRLLLARGRGRMSAEEVCSLGSALANQTRVQT